MSGHDDLIREAREYASTGPSEEGQAAPSLVTSSREFVKRAVHKGIFERFPISVMEAVGYTQDGYDSLLDSIADNLLAGAVQLADATPEEAWANWFERNSAHVGGKPVFTADEVATLLRGPRPFGVAAGDGFTRKSGDSERSKS